MKRYKTDEEFKNQVKEKFEHIEVLGNYVSSQHEMQFKCLKHNIVFTKTAYYSFDDSSKIIDILQSKISV